MRPSLLTLAIVSSALPLMALAPPASAGPGDLTLASTSDTGIKANTSSYLPSLSADGTKVAFYSAATNLDPTDTDTNFDVYVKDLATGDITLASTTDAGTKANSHSYQPSLSADGTKVAFHSQATNLDPADTDATSDIYVKDLVTGDLTLASTTVAGAKGNGRSEQPSLSADGTKVAFDSSATNLDPTGTSTFGGVYVKDLDTGDLAPASTTATGTNANHISYLASLSGDGTKVAFTSVATNLYPGDTDFGEDVYVKDLVTGDLAVASTTVTGAKGNGTSVDTSLSGDGTKVAFLSNATNLDPADTDANFDLYVKDLVTGDLTLVATTATASHYSDLGPSLSADGTRVAFFSLASNLDPADTDANADVYVTDLVTGHLTLASTTATGTKGNLSSYQSSLSADGTRVAFFSGATNLDAADTDTRQDVYVKEIGDPDGDEDGVPDAVDNCPDTANPGQTDTDSDGAGNACDDTPTGDTDGDGVDNGTDNCPAATNPGQTDTDGDGAGDACDPTPTGDTDGDGIDNGTDNCPAAANPAQEDTDGDGAGDACDSTPTGDTDGDGVDNGTDNCPAAANPGQTDTDGDGAGDACDGTPTGDTDGDGVDNGTDNCPAAANPGQTDTDGDGAGDACDPTPTGDTDGDGVDNGTDNCPAAANPGQTDTDGDGAGDACDGTPTGDTDGDGVDNGTDNCPAAANPGQVDTDGDGAGDACDPTPNGDTDGDGVDQAVDNCPDAANPDQTDTDGDGAGDACDPTPNGDTDGDGVDNGTDNCPAAANPGQTDTDSDGAGDACDPTPDGDTDTDGDGVPNGSDSCPTTAEDLDGNQDADGCPESAEHDVAVTTFRTWLRANLADCGSTCTAPIRIRIRNLGTHRETDVSYSVAASGGSIGTYSAACSGNAALRSRDRDLDPGETIEVRGCTVTYRAPGVYTHGLSVHHGTTTAERLSDDALSNNTATVATRVR